jgi:DNA (cytosine-5)-methyltransferase 1
MLRVIRDFRPTWVIAENVGGLVTWNDGMVFEQVCTDLEDAGYEVQPFIIPAVAVNAPHRRDRIWFVANRTSDRRQRRGTRTKVEEGFSTQPRTTGKLPGRPEGPNSDATHAAGKRLQGKLHGQGENGERQQDASFSGSRTEGNDVTDTGRERRQSGSHESVRPESKKPVWEDGSISSWQRNWTEVAAELCSVDDGLPAELDGFKLSKSQHRKEQLKAYGNAIVPQVSMEIMKAMKETI